MSAYRVYTRPEAWRALKELPGHLRQRLRRAIDDLSHEPRPSQSKRLDLPDATLEVRRLRMDRWRVIYMVDENEHAIDVLGLRKRPPYDYGDLAGLLSHEL
ncbi:MAG TPA: type II toxin-antitoxin system RelE/ParE family toxin [Anaerolineae bacterium]|nr:type II toxin-antitoxin system RelE/ParE family toxin [Anaerolineae bacterium]